MVGELDVCFYGSVSNAAVVERPENTAPKPTLVQAAEASAKLSADRSAKRTHQEHSSGHLDRRLGDASVLTLDGYGTLVDRESGVIAALMPWLHDIGVTAGRGEIVRAFAQAERANLKPGRRYRNVLTQVHDAIAEFFGVTPDRKAAEDFAASIGRWPVHQEVPEALAYLKQHFQLVVVTNADHADFAVTNEALGVEFDAVYSAEDAGSYKPSTAMFSYLLNRLDEAGIDKRQVLHVAGSIRFDHVPAKRLGMNTCWIQRDDGKRRLAHAEKRGLDVHPDFRFKDLAAFAEAHAHESQAAA